MLRETPDDRRVAPPGLHCMTIVVVWKRFVKKMNLLRILYLQFFLKVHPRPRRVAFVSLEFYRMRTTQR